ncbi:hypothetical protein KP509_19G078600 [Ceratopteris richardii]|uniref:Uncharacterized protein n=1 Tax=Ceratopteris richardii TaxID=49495 RepID=A0A8T2SR64_CERRI|nr:hypothetical protein KP509_19G078600 [Ceratopteris richardii]
MAQLGLVMPCLLLLRKEDRFHVQPVSWNMAPEKRYEYDRSMRQKECVSKMYGRRITLRKHEEEPFDKCTSEYYSCSRKGLQSRKNSYKFRRNLTKNEFDDSDAGDLLEHSSNIYDVDGPDVSSSSEDNAHECQRNASKCDCSSVKKGIDELHSTSLQSSGSENCLLFERVYKFGYASQRDSEEDPSFAVLSASGRPLAAAKGSICHKRVFPPPLSLVATQSYCAKSGLSPNACTAGAGYCLRSIRCNGRFMLQEVLRRIRQVFPQMRIRQNE